MYTRVLEWVNCAPPRRQAILALNAIARKPRAVDDQIGSASDGAAVGGEVLDERGVGKRDGRDEAKHLEDNQEQPCREHRNHGGS
jgi:hypothetical protein